MATAATFNQDDEDKKNEGQIGAPAGGGVVGTGSAGPAPMAGRATRPGGFVGLQRYMQAQGDAGAKLGQTVAGDVEQEAQGAETARKEALQQFRSQSHSNIVDDISQQILDDPTKVTSEQYKQTTGGYTGPMGLQGEQYQQAVEKARKAQTRLGQLGSAAGQEALLREKYGSPQYTRGLSSLDMALMGGTTAAQDRFKGLRSLYGEGGQKDIGGALSRSEKAASARAKELQTQGAERATAAQEALASATSGLQTDIRAAADEATAERQKRYDDLRKAIESGDIRRYSNLFGGATQLKGAEIDAALAGLKGNYNVSAEQAMSGDQYARMKALEALGGTSLGFGPKQQMTGGAGYTFDPTGFEAARKARIAEVVSANPGYSSSALTGDSAQDKRVTQMIAEEALQATEANALMPGQIPNLSNIGKPQEYVRTPTRRKEKQDLSNIPIWR